MEPAAGGKGSCTPTTASAITVTSWSPAAQLIGTPRKRTISAGEVSHGRSSEPSWHGSGRGGAGARVWRGGARARGQDVAPAQDSGGAAAVARGRPGNRLARVGRH